ncbi:MAG: hypothetical protein J3K34DRAFT_431261 [Monoraphidium minutum]|nr:MAG: hypothetical protein J3K34DRAFT_431261 [Monoraphidium minutum]
MANTLENRQYFPAFEELPIVDEFLDPNYYVEVAGGGIYPIKTWCFFAEIVDDSLSQMPEFFNRCEVRDITGETSSVLFGEAGGMDFRQLRAGRTLFVRYACKCFFSDLATQVLKVEDLSMVKVVDAPPDLLLSLSQYYWDRSRCAACRAPLPAASSIQWCGGCGAAAYCSAACQAKHRGDHGDHCHLCRQLSIVLSIDFDRYVEPVPFR